MTTLTNLRCEYVTNPLGLDSPDPRLSWQLIDERRGVRQIAYHVQVASAEATLHADAADLWDSGRIQSDQSSQVGYAGRSLESGQRAFWRVRIWDHDGQASPWSATAWWEMGLLKRADWQGNWIGMAQTAQDGLLPSPYLRKIVHLDRPVRRARLYATARGLYELRINGNRVGEALLTPGWTDYDARIQYQTYDVTPMLRSGDNAIGAILGTGWYCGHVGFQGRSQHYGARPQLLLQLHLEYTDGSTAIIGSDTSWKAALGPIVSSDLLMGESYDARKELPRWDQPDFDDSDWQPVIVTAYDSALLVADRAQPVIVTEERTPTSITKVGRKTYVFDLGQNMVGWVRLRVRGKRGTRIRLRFAEMLKPNGQLYTTSLRRAKQTDTYILRGEGEEVFEPRFTFHGFRYVELSGYADEPSLDTLTGCVIHSATPPTGDFACSNDLVNQLYRNIVWGQRGNFLSIPTDCPQRDERLGWLGDAQIFVRTAAYNMDVAAFFTKWMIDVEDAQSAAGGFPDVAPRLVDLSDGAPAWGDAGVIIPWTIYRQYGDTAIIDRHWDAMERWMAYLQQANPDDLRVARLNNNFGDWLSIHADTPKDVLATAYYAYCAALMVHMAHALDRTERAEQYQRLFERIKAAFNAAYVSDDGRISGETQTCYVLALHMDLLPSDLRPAAARHLVADIERRGGHLSTGFVGVGYLLPVLTEAGYVDAAYRLLENETYPSWGYSIRHGATTIWERWDGWTEQHGFQTPAMNSFNHYALGSVGEWLYRYVAGVDLAADHVGFQQIIIRPTPGGSLTFARATYDSIHGRIGCAWQIEDGAFMLDVELPANTTATVYVPAAQPADVTEQGSLAHDSAGVTFLRMEADRAVFAVASGRYQFRSVGDAARRD